MAGNAHSNAINTENTTEMPPIMVPNIKSGFGAELSLTQNSKIEKYKNHEAINSGFFISKEASIAMNENPVHTIAANNRNIKDFVVFFMMNLTVEPRGHALARPFP